MDDVDDVRLALENLGTVLGDREPQSDREAADKDALVDALTAYAKHVGLNLIII